MNTFNEILSRLDSQRHYAYSFIRIFLGVALFIRGWILVSDPAAIIELVRGEQLHVWYSYIAIAHLLGGFLMTFGLFTRVGALIQIPILFSAVFIVHAQDGLMMGGQSLELAALVLFLLHIYLIFGTGELTIEKYVVKSISSPKTVEAEASS
jgi:putative oxidoreductase